MARKKKVVEKEEKKGAGMKIKFVISSEKEIPDKEEFKSIVLEKLEQLYRVVQFVHGKKDKFKLSVEEEQVRNLALSDK